MTRLPELSRRGVSSQVVEWSQEPLRVWRDGVGGAGGGGGGGRGRALGGRLVLS